MFATSPTFNTFGRRAAVLVFAAAMPGMTCAQESPTQHQRLEESLQAAPVPASQAQQQPRAEGSANAALPAKKAGVPRIGVLLPKVQIAQNGREAASTDLAEALRKALVASMAGPVVEIVPITSRAEIQVEAEAKEKQCDFLLQTSLVGNHPKSSWKRGLPAATSMASMIPMVGLAGRSVAGAVAAEAAAYGAVGLSVFAESTHAKDELKLEYALLSPSDMSTVARQTNAAVAKSDGENIMSPLVDKAAANILAQVTKR
jgi:hypothetical protein